MVAFLETGWAEGQWELFNAYRVSVFRGEKGLKIGYATMQIVGTLLNYTFKMMRMVEFPLWPSRLRT